MIPIRNESVTIPLFFILWVYVVHALSTSLIVDQMMSVVSCVQLCVYLLYREKRYKYDYIEPVIGKLLSLLWMDVRTSILPLEL